MYCYWEWTRTTRMNQDYNLICRKHIKQEEEEEEVVAGKCAYAYPPPGTWWVEKSWSNGHWSRACKRIWCWKRWTCSFVYFTTDIKTTKKYQRRLQWCADYKELTKWKKGNFNNYQQLYISLVVGKVIRIAIWEVMKNGHGGMEMENVLSWIETIGISSI